MISNALGFPFTTTSLSALAYCILILLGYSVVEQLQQCLELVRLDDLWEGKSRLRQSRCSYLNPLVSLTTLSNPQSIAFCFC